MAPARQEELLLGPTLPGLVSGRDLVDSGPIEARPYQSECNEAIHRWWQTRPREDPVVVLPTASGKTIIFSMLIRGIIEQWSDVRVLILAHRQELLAQAELKLLRVWPEAPTGIYCAGLGRRQIRQVTIASRDSIASLTSDELGWFDVVIVDEAHRIGEDDATRYQQIINRVRAVNKLATVIGFTATPYRTDSGYVYGEDRMFTGVAYERTIREMVRDGYLADVRAAAVRNQIDVTGIRTVAGDYSQKQLGERATVGDLLDNQLTEWEQLAHDRTSTVFFCVNVEHAMMVSDRLLDRNYTVPALHAKTPADERAQVLAQFDGGQIDGIANVGVLTEGWDCPRLDCIAILRPTKALGLFIQMVGRGLRPSPATGKTDCLLLDFGGCLQRFGPIDRAKPAAKGKAADRARVKECDNCGTLNPMAASACQSCGTDFGCVSQLCEACGAENRMSAAQCEACGALLMPEELEIAPATDAVFSDQHVRARNIQCYEVDEVEFVAMTSKADKRYLRIWYYCGLERYGDVLCIGYSGWPGRKAMRQIKKMLLPDYEDMPETDPDTFLKWNRSVPGGMVKKARAIYVDLESEWNDITLVEYWTDEKREAAAELRKRQLDDEFLRALDDEIPF